MAKYFPISANVYSIIKSFDDKLLLAVYEGGLAKIYKSSDEGISWSSYSFGLNFTSTDFAISSDGVIFLATAGYGIYKSTDNGNTWNISASVGYEYSCLFIDGNTIYAGTSGNWVYRSTDLGQTWNLLNCGMGQDNYVLSLTGSNNGYLYAGMDYYGIYRSNNQVLSVENDFYTITDFVLCQNYPNPFSASGGNSNTKIRFNIPESNNFRNEPVLVTLKVYDILGNEITTLVNENKTTGIYEVEFSSELNGYYLPSGIYFYKLTAGSFSQIRKMILMR